jgi:hypothetical protein
MFDYDVYAVCGGSDMMEGGEARAASFAGPGCWATPLDLRQQPDHHRGHTDLAFSDDARALAYG